MAESRPDRIGEFGGEYLDSLVSLVTSVLITIRGSFIAFVVAVGVIFLATSVLLSSHVLGSVQYAKLAAMTFIWGVSAFVYAVLGTILLRLIDYS